MNAITRLIWFLLVTVPVGTLREIVGFVLAIVRVITSPRGLAIMAYAGALAAFAARIAGLV